MKFKHSTYELIYDRFWNIYIKPLDSMIRRISEGANLFEINISFRTLIKKLAREIKQIFLSLDNPKVSFEDPYSIKEYRQNLVKKTLEYFSFYTIIYPQHQELTTTLLGQIGIKK